MSNPTTKHSSTVGLSFWNNEQIYNESAQPCTSNLLERIESISNSTLVEKKDYFFSLNAHYQLGLFKETIHIGEKIFKLFRLNEEEKKCVSNIQACSVNVLRTLHQAQGLFLNEMYNAVLAITSKILETWPYQPQAKDLNNRAFYQEAFSSQLRAVQSLCAVIQKEIPREAEEKISENLDNEITEAEKIGEVQDLQEFSNGNNQSAKRKKTEEDLVNDPPQEKRNRFAGADVTDDKPRCSDFKKRVWKSKNTRDSYGKRTYLEWSQERFHKTHEKKNIPRLGNKTLKTWYQHHTTE